MTQPPAPACRLPDPIHDHYQRLAGAHTVGTKAARETEQLIKEAIEHHSIICIHGQVGLGKTFAVHRALRKFAPHNTVRLRFDASATKTEVYHAFWRALALPGKPLDNLAACKGDIRQALASQPHVLLIDEVQNINTSLMESARILWDEETNPLTVILVGSGNTRQRVLRHAPLHSRLYQAQQFRPLSLAEVFNNIPPYHAVWNDADQDLLAFTDDAGAHGYFRNWAKITFHAQEALKKNPELTMSKELIRWILGRLDTTTRHS
ncbi:MULTISPECIES: ATP-binding protein [Streptomyces]|uniref:AAA+ ATPase domain-containing protein n=1 Tax=Streptomyces yatensis TaxID=155177 RepID=A0ABN2JMV3_9ACTN|nr:MULTISPECIES: ATP-binding protein [Streptomyces]MCG0284047.1 ATP-binding protein [Streptomyces sp. PSAA01]